MLGVTTNSLPQTPAKHDRLNFAAKRRRITAKPPPYAPRRDRHVDRGTPSVDLPGYSSSVSSSVSAASGSRSGRNPSPSSAVKQERVAAQQVHVVAAERGQPGGVLVIDLVAARPQLARSTPAFRQRTTATGQGA
jgi:hypothetical protein